MSRRRVARSLTCAAIALVLVCPDARAGTPFTVGTGAHPDLAMDASGLAHVVWRERIDPSNYAIHYCQIPAGGKACANTQTLGPPTGLDDPLVVLGGGAVYVVVPHYVADTVDVFTSTDGGASFTGPVTLSESTPSNRLVGTDSEDAIFGPGQSITLTTWNTGQYVLNFPVPPVAGRVTAANFSSPFLYNFAVALNGASPVAVGWEIPGGGAPPQFAVWTQNGPNLNDAASWSGPTAVGQGQESALAGGPSGLFAMTSAYAGSQGFPSVWEVRRFTASGFGPPTVVATGETTGCQSCNDLFQDSGGGLYAAWRGPGSTVRLATSGNGGASFASPYEIAAEQAAVTIANLHVAAVPGGSGLVVYDQNSDTGQIRAADLTASPPPPPVAGVAVNVQVVSGQVLVKLPGAKARQKGQGYVPLTQARQIPVGSILDTSKGTVALTAAASSAGATQVGQFTAGLFQILQARAARPVTRLKLTGSSFSKCGKTTARAARRKKLSPRTIRQIRADAKGRFRTEGRFAAATVRGTAWGMYDRCDGTLTRVRRGVVVVRDRLARKTITLRAGKSYLARAR